MVKTEKSYALYDYIGIIDVILDCAIIEEIVYEERLNKKEIVSINT